MRRRRFRILWLVGGLAAFLAAGLALHPFTKQTRYMSCCGYLRWLHHQETGSWN